MSKRTISLIIILFLITAVLFIIALRENTSPASTQTAVVPTPTPFAHSVLSFEPSTVNFTLGSMKPQVVAIQLNTGGNDVTGVQLEMTYVPTAFNQVNIANGLLFPNPFVIFPPKADTMEGTISFAYGITPGQYNQQHKGFGTVALLTLTPALNPVDINGNRITQTQIKFLPKSLITAKGIDPSVMNKTTFNNVLTINYLSGTVSATVRSPTGQ